MATGCLIAANPSPRKRRLFWLGVLLGFGLLLARLLFLQGILFPIRIAGGSMAETLVGDHDALVCDDCHFPFRCGVEGLSRDNPIVCPNCGDPRNVPSTDKLRRGQRVLIDRFPTFIATPQRWQVVAIKNPSTPGELAVKRIIGLPGERVAIRHGDIFINDKIVTKPPAVKQDLRLNVHDDCFRPSRTKALPPRWAPESTDSSWIADPTGYSFAANTSKEASLETKWDWLTYRHWRCFTSPFPRTDVTPLLDNDPYSPNESRELHEVSDITLSFRASLAATSQFAVKLDTGRDQFVFQLSADKKEWQCEQNGRPLAKHSAPSLAPGSDHDWEFSLCDQTAVLYLDHAEILRADFVPSPPSDRSAKEVPSHAAIGAATGRIQITHLQLSRDVYYLPRFGIGDHWTLPVALGPNEYFVLGDNPAISVDSRDPSFGVVPCAAIIGQVRRAPSP